VSDTSHLQSKDLWLRNHDLSTKTVWQILPSTAFGIQKKDGMPDSDGQLQTFNDVYHIKVSCNSTPVSTLQPTLKGVHVDDKQIFILHDIIVGR